jgi:hypothetical protein
MEPDTKHTIKQTKYVGGKIYNYVIAIAAKRSEAIAKVSSILHS